MYKCSLSFNFLNHCGNHSVSPHPSPTPLLILSPFPSLPPPLPLSRSSTSPSHTCQGGCVLRKFSTLCSPLAVVEEKKLQLSQKTVLCMGKAKYDSQESIHSICELSWPSCTDTCMQVDRQ